jgi:hypothetical protein
MFAKTHWVLKEYSIEIPDGFLEIAKERAQYWTGVRSEAKPSWISSRRENQEAMTEHHSLR